MKNILIKTLLVMGLMFLIMIVLAISPTLGVLAGLIITIVATISFFKPIPSLGLTSKGFSIAILFFAGAMPLITGLGMMSDTSTTVADSVSENEAAGGASNDGEQSQPSNDIQESEIANSDTEQETADTEEAKNEETGEEEDQSETVDTSLSEEAKDYVDQLDRELASIGDADPYDFTETKESLFMGIVLINLWVQIYEDGKDLGLDESNELRRQKFKNEILKKQQEMLPVFRDSFGPMAREEFESSDVDVKTIGDGFRTIRFTSPIFVLDEAVEQIHPSLADTYEMFRFKKVEYLISEGGQGSVIDINSPEDSDLVFISDSGINRIAE